LGIDLTYSNNNAVTNADDEWTVVNTKNYVYKSANYNQSKTVKAGHFMKTSNRYTPLTNVSADNEGTIPVLINRKISTNGNITVNSGSSQPPSTLGKTTPVKIKNTYFPKQTKKIIIIGDSHARCCATNVKSSLNDTFQIMGSVMPGSRLEHIMSLARSEISHLSRNDFVVVWGVTNDISKMSQTLVSDT